MKTKGRYLLISTTLFMVVSGLAWRMISLQVFEKGFLQFQGDARTIRVVGTPAYRGMITDRNGEPLAISTPVNSVWLNPKEIDKEHPELLALAAILDISLEQLQEKIARNSGREFIYLQRHVQPAVAEQIQKLDIMGVHLKPEYRRYYPAGEVVSHVIGFTDIDEKGQEGLELAFDDWLQGRKGSKRIVRDRLGREIQILEGLKEMRSGQNVMLSLDQRLQYLAYRELKAAVTEHQAVAGSAVVIDVQTGEILAMVNQPSFNPNLRLKCRADGRHRNRAVADKLEPGSVMKTFSVVSALQNGRVTPATMVDTAPGWMTVGGHVVREVKNENYGMLDVSGILKKSSNVGVSKLALSLPPECLWETYNQLGFGTVTGSGFPGESSGTLNRPPKKGSFVLATMAFGYGISVTPLQLAQAYATLGAGGVKRPVTFLKQSEIPSGEQVIDPIVARQVVSMLSSVVEQGSGSKAKVVGYYTAGKTGTARKISVTGGYNKDSHVSVFAGLAPASNPRFAIVVVVDDPQGKIYYGSQIAAPIFSKIAAGALRLFNIPSDALSAQNLQVASANKSASVHE
jgi:cell division protein FtsI (penicillin-binding protein 3)